MTAEIPEWVLSTPATPAIHETPPEGYQWQQLPHDELDSLRGNLIESIVSAVVEVISGFLPFARPAIEFFGDIFNDLFGLLGNPLGLGTGDPSLPDDASSIPLLGPVIGLLEDLPVIGDIVQAITGILDGDLTDLTEWASNIPILGTVISWITGGLVPVPVGSVTDVQPNLLPAPLFSAGAIADNPRWTVDPAVTRSADGTGAARITLDGTVAALRSGETPTDRITVAAGQKVSLSVWVKHTAYTGTGSPIQLHVVPFIGDTEQPPYTLATYAPTGTLDWPGHELAGVYEVPADVTAIQARIFVAATATGGVAWFDDAESKQVGLLQQEWVDGLPGVLGSIWDRFSNILESIFEALTGGIFGGGIDDLLGGVMDALQNIPFFNILGVGGPADIGGSVMGVIDSLISGFVGIFDSGAGLPDLFNVGQEVSSNASLGKMGWDILGIRSNKPLASGMLATSESSLPLTQVMFGAAPPTFPLTQSTAITLYQRASESAPIGVVRWKGNGVTNITHFFVNIWKMDPETGDRTLVHASSNIVGDVSAAQATNKYIVPVEIMREPGDIYGYELAVRGSGTHNVVGDSTWDGDDPDVIPRRMSSVRDSGTTAPPATIAHAATTYSSNIPFIEVGIEVGNTPLPHSPETLLFNAVGTSTMPIPSWVNFVDRIVLGGGGGGHQGGTWGVGGQGGGHGPFVSDTISRGTHFTDGDSVTTIVGAGGSAGLPGANGQSSQSKIGSSHVLTGAGGEGAGGFDLFGIGVTGEGPGNYTFPGGGPAWSVAGGGDQASWDSPGVAPGGGGGGGNWLLFGGGGNGAPGAVWYRFRQ